MPPKIVSTYKTRRRVRIFNKTRIPLSLLSVQPTKFCLPCFARSERAGSKI